MTTTFRARYDGHVIVPEEPVDLPINEPIVLQRTSNGSGEVFVEDAIIQERLRRWQEFSGSFSAPPLQGTLSRSENPYDEREDF
jgi:hypothetical protein